ELIDKNLFIKTEVDKTVCFLGEAITATFKLYSRLQSTSEVINAPSLYGFSIMDMLNINEAHQAVETINGKVFNTSVLRKLQLYPAQTGQLAIDEMQLENEIEFNDSTTGKKLKIKKLLASRPVTISVKPLPGQQPANYSGAVGKFTVQAAFQNPELAVNAQGKLIVTISGKGNFLQFGPPAINWPKEFEVFDPIATDELNKNKAPTEGRRMYTYSFTADRTGNFVIPAVSFSFFNPVTASYQNLSSDSLQLKILPASAAKKTNDNSEAKQSHKAWWVMAFAAFAFLLSAIFLFKKRKKQPPLPVPVVQPSYLQKLRQLTSSGLTGREICTEIQNLLIEVNREHHLTPGQKQLWQTIRNDCQLLVYSDIQMEDKKLVELQKKVQDLLQQIES
ncbi:MAG TPA: BatD family protein, partial [Flavisolibacter sp.]|nr:BatD family protein [Flavisolibacter sp.]